MDKASAGDAIRIAAGIYAERLALSKDLHISGASAAAGSMLFRCWQTA